MQLLFNTKIPATDTLFVLLPLKPGKKDFSSLLPDNAIKEIKSLISAGYFEGKPGETHVLATPIPKVKRVVVFGIGEIKKPLTWRKGAALAIRKANEHKVKNPALLLGDNGDVRRAASGVMLGNYKFKIGNREEESNPDEVHVLCSEKHDAAIVASEVALCEGVNLTRDLINTPPNFMTPDILAQAAQKIAKKSRKLSVKILKPKEMAKLGMGLLLGVGQGSVEESRLIILEYKGGDKKEKPVAFVGKGVCFDSGGYNLKPTNYIEEMKSDMAGAASVLGLFDWIAHAEPEKNIVGVIGAVENLVSGNAMKPGDILTSMKGDTVEITNTDAEGRLVLADCLYYTAKTYEPEYMVDLATLTGACIVALGNEIAGVMGNDDKVVKSLLKAAKDADEEMWELPLNDFFREKIKGDVSDLINATNGVGAGSSMGGAFLDHFVEKTPWAHLDIAGVAFHGKAGDELSPKGATGAVLRTLRELIEPKHS